MRDAVPPPFRIAAGLLLAVLLSVVGCQVLRWRNPASPEALLERADEMSWLNSWIAADPFIDTRKFSSRRNTSSRRQSTCPLATLHFDQRYCSSRAHCPCLFGRQPHHQPSCGFRGDLSIHSGFVRCHGRPMVRSETRSARRTF